MGSDRGGPDCYGVPMYRQWLTLGKRTRAPQAKKNPSIRLIGEAIFQRNTLSANHGKYYIDTAASEATQRAQPRVSSFTVFQENRRTTPSWFREGHDAADVPAVRRHERTSWRNHAIFPDRARRRPHQRVHVQVSRVARQPEPESVEEKL